MKNGYTWKFEVKLTVDPQWVADGFDLESKETLDREMKDWIELRLPSSYSHETEVSCRLISTPGADRIRKEQGYQEEVGE